MIVTLVHVWVLTEKIDDFIKACHINHNESVKESGNLRFDVLQDASDPTKFTLYEAYESEAASMAHKDTPHYKFWRETVENWMAKPREGVKHKILFPSDKKKWQ
jgi:autoinducer 2-degrading protein